MTCHDFDAYLSAYLDRELSAGDAALLAEHAETCARCQKARTEILSLKTALRDIPMPGIPADLIAAIEAQTLLKHHWWESEGFKTRWLPAFVAVATAVGALALSKHHVNPTPQGTIPMVAAPRPGPVITHALLPQESSNENKGDSREN